MAASASVAEERRTRVRKVLLVDDHEMYLKYCSREFIRAGVEVRSAQTLVAAQEIVRYDQPHVAVVDLFLTPPENGLDVIRALKELDPELFCVLVSAHMSVSHALMGIRAGADDVLIKPFGAKQIIARVEYGAVDRPEAKTPTLHEVEWEHIARVLHDHQGNITQAAESLGIFRQSLQRKIQKYAPRALDSDLLLPYPIARDPEPEPEPEPEPPPPAPRPRAKKKRKKHRRH